MTKRSVVNRWLALLALSVLLVGVQQVLAQSVRINEVNPSGHWLELKNTGDEPVDVSDLWLCNRPTYTRVSGLKIISGEMVIPAGGFLVVEWAGVRDNKAELGLYSGNNFGNSQEMLDYLEYGGAGGGRESVASTAGLWDAGTFVTLPEDGASIIFVEEGDTALAHWVQAAEPSAGEDNTAE